MGSCLGTNVQAFVQRIKRRQLGPVLYDRYNNRLVREKLPIRTWLENGILYSKPIDVIDRTKIIHRFLKNETISSEHSHNTYASAQKIPKFVDFYSIKMEDFVPDNPHSYKTFNDFFIREVVPEKRPISEPDDDAIITSAADCRLYVFPSVSAAHALFIKGKNFNLNNLISKGVKSADRDRAAQNLSWMSQDLSMVNFRLSPMDYHRFHSPVSGTIESIYHIDGQYFTVEPKALESDIDVLGENARSVVSIATENNGRVLFIPIGAEAVGKVVLFVTEGQKVNKGEELGYFDYGGSDIVAVFEQSVLWDDDLDEHSQMSIETLLHCNDRIGQFVPPSVEAMVENRNEPVCTTDPEDEGKEYADIAAGVTEVE